MNSQADGRGESPHHMMMRGAGDEDGAGEVRPQVWARSRPLSPKIEWAILGLIYLAYFLLAWGYATQTPDWQIPDEPAHYNYVRQVVETHQLPVIEMGDWNQEYQVTLVATGFDEAYTDRLDQIQYEDHQPPLYYLLQTLAYPDLTHMRLFSALIGSGIIICTWALVRRMTHMPILALSAAAFVAFIPQRLAIMGGLSNDSLAETLVALTLLVMTSYLSTEQPQPRLALAMGVLVGLVFLTKTTAYYVAGVAGIAILLRWWRERWALPVALRHIGLYAVPALLMGSIWWVHGIQTYGGTDILGLQRHDEVVVGQLRTEDYINIELGGSQRLYWENLTRTTFQSFWGQFGWMAFPFKPDVFRLLRLWCVLTLIGLGIYGVSQYRHWTRLQWEWHVLLLLSITLVGAQFLLYNRSFVQFQGRYLYPALIPVAYSVALGWEGWVVPLQRRFPLIQWLPLLVTSTFVALSWYALDRVVSLLP
ncbi:MAG: glycosyltransferase family 39 protein [Anaerolineales bacterium]|nr:glycosyltransferase family 39 protein [Anaerolineales bacterium]